MIILDKNHSIFILNFGMFSGKSLKITNINEFHISSEKHTIFKPEPFRNPENKHSLFWSGYL